MYPRRALDVPLTATKVIYIGYIRKNYLYIGTKYRVFKVVPFLPKLKKAIKLIFRYTQLLTYSCIYMCNHCMYIVT